MGFDNDIYNVMKTIFPYSLTQTCLRTSTLMQQLESCTSSFVEYKIAPSLNKHTTLKFSEVNAENSTTTITTIQRLHFQITTKLRNQKDRFLKYGQSILQAINK